MTKFSMLALLFVVFCIPGCASVSVEGPEKTANAKKFAPPPPDRAGLYIYRSSFVGQAFKRDIWINGKCVGSSANDVFFYELLPGNTEYTIVTESEFSTNELILTLQNGVNYFVEQGMPPGVFMNTSVLVLMDPASAKSTISKLDLAVGGNCKKSAP